MARIFMILIFTGLLGCKQIQPPKILSPIEKVKVLPYQDILTISTENPDTIEDLNSFIELDSIWVIGAGNGVYIIDNSDQILRRYFKFDIKSHFELFDGQDSIVGFNFSDLAINMNKSKLLVQTSNGIVFQINISDYKIDWLVKFVNRIETATYSDNGKLIAIGTRYDYKNKVGRSITEYYSSLFLIDSKEGKYIGHFNESASVKKILFKDNDSKLLVAYDWNYTDTYLWDINQKDKSIAQFRENDAYLYDISILTASDFITINGNGISKWEFNNPGKKNLIYNDPNSGSERIAEDRLTEGHILIDYTELKYFDSEFELLDIYKFEITFDEITYSNNDSIIILINLMDEDDRREGFYYFHLSEKRLMKQVDRTLLNKIIKANLD